MTTAQWEEVADCTHRLRVPGGWLYRYKYGGFFSLAFVPSEAP